MLKIDSVHAFSWSPTATAKVKFGEIEMEVKLSEACTAEILAVAMRYVQDEQQRLAATIAEAQPALLPSPDVIDGEYDEVDDEPL